MSLQKWLQHSNTISRTNQMLIAMVAGLVIGAILRQFPDTWMLKSAIVATLDLGGEAFIKLMKFLVVPIVFVSLLCGCSSVDDQARLSRVGFKSISLFLALTLLAVSIALILSHVLQVGVGQAVAENVDYHYGHLPNPKELILNFFPGNPFQALAEGNMLQIIVFAVLMGLALSLSGKQGKQIIKFFNELNTVLMNLMMLIMSISPYGVFCLLSQLVIGMKWAVLFGVMSYFWVVLLGLMIQFTMIYPLFLYFFADLNPWQCYRKLYPAMLLTFSVASSYVSLPAMMYRVRRKLGVHTEIASLTMPMGVTLHMDGTAIMQTVATIFIAHAYGVYLNWDGWLTIVIMTTLSAISTAGVPGAGLVTLVLVLDQLGLPASGIGLIVGVDRLLDMAASTVNITGDAVVACIIARSEAKFDKRTYAAGSATD